MSEFLFSLDWEGNPWPQSHQGAGLYVSLNLGGTDARAFNRAYFDWLWENADPETGFWIIRNNGTKSLFDYMAGSFHYLFNHEYAHMPLRYPEKMIDTCLDQCDQWRRMYPDMGHSADFKDIDWIFCLTRASRQTAHRFDEIRAYLTDFARLYADFWLNADYERNDSINDLHMLFGGVCALAELQQTLRGLYETDKPLKIVLDRRPFI